MKICPVCKSNFTDSGWANPDASGTSEQIFCGGGHCKSTPSIEPVGTVSTFSATDLAFKQLKATQSLATLLIYLTWSVLVSTVGITFAFIPVLADDGSSYSPAEPMMPLFFIGVFGGAILTIWGIIKASNELAASRAK